MVRLRVAAFAIVAACYTPEAPTGAPCTLGTASCPDGQQCRLVAGRPVCVAGDGADAQLDAPADDVDADGIKNVDDNCPAVANANQANEDGDGYGDACDPCPPIVDVDPIVDLDADGVSGPCDPDPITPGDRIAAFEGFAEPLSPDWSASGSWTVVDGSAVLVNQSGEVALLTIASPAAADVPQTVMTAFTVDDFRNNNVRGFGPVQMQSIGPGIACQLRRSGAGPQLAIEQGDGLVDATLAVIDANQFDRGLTAVMFLTRAGTDYRCSDGSSLVAASSDFTTPAPRVGVRSVATSAHVAWILVVAR